MDHDELSPREAAIARVVLGPFHEWNPDIALRYLPIIRLIKKHGLHDKVTDIGSGSIGIGPYLRRAVTGVDTNLTSRSVHPLLQPVEASVLDTPFDDRSRPCVISVDMLEHVPVALRQAAVDELVRIAGRLLIVAVPSGPEAEQHDKEMAELFRTTRGVEFRFFREHVENGLPTPAELADYVERALAKHGRKANVRLLPNANLRLREFIVRRWIRRAAVDKVAWVLLTWLSPVLSYVHREPAYRRLAVVEFRDA
ncbi:MAG TPA: methyltransferase domain-containing protein [Acidimicrobiales bacterium]|nr:methyltransferase domain-containing protein [Acidimicrobiales bacterium]